MSDSKALDMRPRIVDDFPLAVQDYDTMARRPPNGDDDDPYRDWSGVLLHANLEAHIRQCTEWRSEVRKQIDNINSRIWAAAGTIIVLLLGMLGVLLYFYVIQRGGH